jgi:hypothetical protein
MPKTKEKKMNEFSVGDAEFHVSSPPFIPLRVGWVEWSKESRRNAMPNSDCQMPCQKKEKKRKERKATE